MKLRSKTLLVVGSIMIVVIFALYMIAGAILQVSVQNEEARGATLDFEQVGEVLGWTIEGIGKTTRDWAWWDDSYQFIQDGNQEFINSTLGPLPLANIGVNVICYVDLSGGIVFGMAADIENQSEAPFPEDLAGHISLGSAILAGIAERRSASGIILLHDGPLLVSVFPILTSEQQGPVHGALLMGRYMDSDIVADIVSIINISLETYVLDDPAMPNDVKSALTELSEANPVAIKQTSESTLGEYSIIDDIYGNPALAVRINAPRPAYASARSALGYFIVAFAVIGTCFGATAVVVVDRMVLSKIADLNKTAQRIRKSKDNSSRMSVSGNDEISSLGNSFNDLLGSIYDSEKNLRESEERFKQVAENTQECIWEVDASGLYTYVSPVAEKVYGYKPEEIVGKKHFYDMFVPEYRDALKNAALEAFAKKQTFKEFINKNIRKDGKEVWISTSGVPIVGENENLLGYRGADIDITEKKSVETALQQSRDAQEAINNLLTLSLENLSLEDMLTRALQTVTSIPWLSLESRGAIFTVEGDPNVLVMKAQRNLKEPVQKSCALVPFGKCICGRAALSGKTEFASNVDERHEIIYDGMTPHGHYCVPIISSGKTLGVLNLYVKDGHLRNPKEEEFLNAAANVLANTITHKKAEEAKAELEAVKRTSKMKDQFMALATHELHIPITALKGYTEMLLSGKAGAGIMSDVARGLLETIARNTDRLMRLADSLLDVQMIESGTIAVEKKPVNLRELLEGCAKNAEGAMKAKRQNFEVSIGKGDFAVEGDESRLEIVFAGILDNASKFTPDGGQIQLDASENEREIKIAISDTGIGIPKDALARVFEPFASIDKPDYFKGAGLSMSVARGIVEAHGGKITVESEGEGKGAAFIVTLPKMR
jgi:PAS domain S-box-containing protein